MFILKSLISKYVNKKKEKIFACFVDLRRAFDTLWHNGLRYKLIKNGLGKKFYEVISDMYNLTESSIKIDNKISKSFILERGVKQGDSFSPTIFNCFINDIHQIFDNTCKPLVLQKSELSSLSFADDLVIMSSSHIGLQNAINKLEKYCYDWQLTVNTKKTKVMTFQNKFSPTPVVCYKNIQLNETKEYNFLGNIINYKGNFKNAIQELSKKGLKVLFALTNRFSNFQSIPVNLSCKLFDVLIRPVLLYNSEVWFMEDYLSMFKSLKRSEQHGSVCDTLSLEDKFCYEMIHNKYCKSVLGLRKTACNISAKTELGRFSMASFIKPQVMLYFCRFHTNDINPLLKEAYELNKSLHNDGFHSWYTFALNIFKETGLNAKDFETCDKPYNKIKYSLKMKFKQISHEFYTKKLLNKLSSITDSSKLFLYGQIKTEIKIENYLLKESNFKTRQLISKLRVSDHNLEVEMGRYKNVPRDQRLCKLCNKIDDEYHFLLYCKLNSTLRDCLFLKINNLNPDFTNYQPLLKLKQLLNPKSELLTEIGDFIKQSLELRK